MARFRLPRLNPNLRAYFSHFGRSIILVLAIIVVVGLAAATYFYGQRKQDKAAPQTESTSNTSEQAPSQSTTDSPSNTSNPSPTQNTSPAPSTLINTGPGDWALPATILLCILVTLYKRSRKELDSALHAV